MSTAPRRSLRLRNGNLPDEKKEEPKVEVKAAAPKRRAANDAERENAPKGPLKKKVKDEVKEEEEDEEMANEEEKEVKEEDDGGSEEEMEEKKPTKNGERSPKKKSETAAASAADGTRPKRRCSLAATKAFKEMTNSDGPSDDEDFDIENEMKKKKNEQKELTEQASTSVLKEKKKKEKEDGKKKKNEQKELTQNAMEMKEKMKNAMGKAKKKRGKRMEMEEDTETEEDNEEEKTVKKDTKKAGASSSRGPKLQRPPSLDRHSEKVRLLMDKKYNVDRDQMLAWEKRSVHMARELRKLESCLENESGRQKEINTRVREFVERCLKDRRCEMGLEEAVRQCHVLQGEFDEWERKKKMTITQRIKEQVENEKKEKEADESDENEEEEDEWEDMETVDGEGEVKTMQVHVENKKIVDKKTLWYSKWLKQEVNRSMRTRCGNTHKSHLLSYISHLRHLAAMALSPNSKEGEIPLSAVALSMIPPKGKKMKTREKEREHLIEWWYKQFEKVEDEDEGKDDKSEEIRMSERMMKRRFTNHKEAALMLFSLLAAGGFTVRIVCRCQVITKKVPESAETKKKEEKKDAGKKKKKNDSSEESRDYPSIDYWIEVWDEEKETWNPIPAIPVEPPSNDEYDEDEEWKVLVEPLNACMEKDGRVLYMLAIDNEFAIRDVSARYIHPQNFVSREFRNRRAGQEWLNELWEMEPWRAHSIRSSKEDDEWMTSMKVELPKTVTQYKDHPLYVLDRDVLKQQRIFPYDVPSLGEIRGYKIYSRKFVRPTHPAKWYEKMGRQVRDDEPPVGEKKLTNPMTGLTQMQGLFGYWQTDEWDAGEVVHGRVPRNEFDNIYMYQPKEMCPKGGIYIIPEGLQRVARDHGKDYVEAVIGWMYKGGNIVPVIKGAVFAKEDLPELIGAWKECEKRWKEEEKKLRSERSLAGWKKLIKGMLRLAAMRKEFEPMENRKKKGTKLGDEDVRAEEAAAWPQQRYGGDMFQ